jgi:transposase
MIRGLTAGHGVMLRTDVVSDELCAVLESVLPADAGRPGRPWNNHRTTSEGIAWRFLTGSPWRELPPEFGVSVGLGTSPAVVDRWDLRPDVRQSPR